MTAYERDCGCRVHSEPAVWPQVDRLCPYHEGEVDGYEQGWADGISAPARPEPEPEWKPTAFVTSRPGRG